MMNINLKMALIMLLSFKKYFFNSSNLLLHFYELLFFNCFSIWFNIKFGLQQIITFFLSFICFTN